MVIEEHNLELASSRENTEGKKVGVFFKEEKQEQLPTKINKNKCKTSSNKKERDKSCRRIGHCLCKTQRKYLKLSRRLKGAGGIGAAPWNFIPRILHRKEVKYKYAPVGTTKARNLYERLYTFATNKMNANTEYHLKKKIHTW